MGWKPADKIAVALHNFKGIGVAQLPVRVGDLLYVMEEQDSGGENGICGDVGGVPALFLTAEWYRGYLFYEPSKRVSVTAHRALCVMMYTYL